MMAVILLAISFAQTCSPHLTTCLYVCVKNIAVKSIIQRGLARDGIITDQGLSAPETKRHATWTRTERASALSQTIRLLLYMLTYWTPWTLKNCNRSNSSNEMFLTLQNADPSLIELLLFQQRLNESPKTSAITSIVFLERCVKKAVQISVISAFSAFWYHVQARKLSLLHWY